jgi:hypothetical protein
MAKKKASAMQKQGQSFGETAGWSGKQIWGYGPPEAVAYMNALDFANQNSVSLDTRSNPSTKTKTITPPGRPKGTFQVWVYKTQ